MPTSEDTPAPEPEATEPPPLILGADGQPLNATEDSGVLVVNGKGDVVAIFELKGCPVENAIGMVKEGLMKYAQGVEGVEAVAPPEMAPPTVTSLDEARAKREGEQS
jgi:hypothetical protein